MFAKYIFYIFIEKDLEENITVFILESTMASDFFFLLICIS